jgi:zinc metalloprotease ZmpB
VADWDSTSYTSGTPHCLRRIDGDKHYPEDVQGEVHADGEMWSASLYDIRQAVGATNADRIIIGAQFRFAPDTTFAEAARKTIGYAHDTAPQYESAVRAAFVSRGFLS